MLEKIYGLLVLVYESLSFAAGFLRRGSQIICYQTSGSLVGSASGSASIKLGPAPNGWIVREISYTSTSDVLTVSLKKQSDGHSLISGQARIASVFRKAEGYGGQCPLPPFEVPGAEELVFDLVEGSATTNAYTLTAICQKL